MKKLISILMVTLMTIALLSGCGKKEDVQKTDEAKVEESTSAEEVSDDTEGAAVEKVEDVTVTVLTAMAYGLERFDELVANYESENPGVTIEVQHAPNDYYTVAKARVNSGDVPDIMTAQSGSYVADFYDFAYDYTGDPVLDKFNQTAIDISMNTDGKVLSLPESYQSMAFIYNKTLFAQAGIDTLPTTLDELEEVCVKLEANGILPFGNGSKEAWVLAHIASHFVSTIDDDPNVIAEKISSGEIDFSSMDDYKKNITRLLDMMVDYGPEKPLEIDWELSENMLANGDAAMIHMGDWAESIIVGFNPDIEMGYLPLPVSDNPDEAVVISGISWQYVLHKDSNNLDASKKFLEYMLTSEDAQDWFTQTLGAVPAAKTTLDPIGMLATESKQYIDGGLTKPFNHNAWPAGYNMEMGALLQGYMAGVTDADATLEAITAGWLDLVE